MMDRNEVEDWLDNHRNIYQYDLIEAGDGWRRYHVKLSSGIWEKEMFSREGVEVRCLWPEWRDGAAHPDNTPTLLSRFFGVFGFGNYDSLAGEIRVSVE